MPKVTKLPKETTGPPKHKKTKKPKNFLIECKVQKCGFSNSLWKKVRKEWRIEAEFYLEIDRNHELAKCERSWFSKYYQYRAVNIVNGERIIMPTKEDVQ